jgi:hypothetical protein
MIFREIAEPLTLDIENADDAILHDQRCGELGTNVGMRLDITRIERSVRDANRFPGLRGGAGNALPQRNIIDSHTLIETHAEPAAQQFLVGIDQINTEGVVVNQRANGRGDLAQQLVQIENRAELLRKVRKRPQRPVLPVHPAV